MYPSETSLIPVTVALARFVESNGLLSMFGQYPYWYLGVPYQYLTGPIIPLLQVFLHNVLPGFSLFDITYLLLLISFLGGVVGWVLLVRRIELNKSIILTSLFIILYLILPWRYLSTLALSEASGTIAKNLLPFAFLAFWHYYKKRSRKRAVYAVSALAILLLINTTVFTIFLVGISGLILAASFRNGKFRGLSRKIKSSLLFIVYSFLLATLWYTSGYWITVFTNPSIGGASGIKVFLRIFDLLRASIPLGLAVGAVYFSGKIKNRLTIFSLTWVFTFLFLTVFRFIGDPDFWQDWSSWFYELEIGLALLASKVIYDLRFKIHDRKPSKILYFVLASLLVPFLLTNYIYGVIHNPKLITDTIPEGEQNLVWLEKIAGSERTFISGSTVFWADALYDLNQVRGGVDKVATHLYWDHAAFQLREGNNPELAKAWLQALGVSKVLIHTSASSEVYHDFRNVDKWKKVGDVVWEAKGDIIIRVPESSHAWVVDLSALEKVSPPEGGVDLSSLKDYLSAKKRSLPTKSSVNEIKILLDVLEEGEGVVIAESFSRNWKASDNFIERKDPLGNILLTPRDYSNVSEVMVTYK